MSVGGLNDQVEVAVFVCELESHVGGRRYGKFMLHACLKNLYILSASHISDSTAFRRDIKNESPEASERVLLC